MNRIRTAVIPAAGLGTRMRPATRAVPKELLPIGGRPVIDWVLEEAWICGIEEVVIVTAPSKPAIEDYLMPARLTGWQPVEVAGNSCSEPALEIRFVQQPRPLGLGDAVRIGTQATSAEAVAVMLPDEVMLGGAVLLSSLLEHHVQTRASVVALLEVEPEDVHSYGCAEIIARRAHGIVDVVGFMGKPDPQSAPSNLAVCGRYALDQDVIAHLGSYSPDANGEIQLTPALDAAARESGLRGLELLDIDGRVDVGNWMGWLDANRRAFDNDLRLSGAQAA